MHAFQHIAEECLSVTDIAVVRSRPYIHRVSKKTSTHIIGYKLRNSCPILIIFDINIPHII